MCLEIPLKSPYGTTQDNVCLTINIFGTAEL